MGSAVVTLNSPRHKTEVISDLDDELVNLFSLMADETAGPVLLNRLLHVEYSEQRFRYAKQAKQKNYARLDSLTRAEHEFVLITQSFNSTKQSFRRKGMTPQEYADLNARNLPLVQKRLRGIRVEKKDCVEVVTMVRSNPHAFVFLDVPYRASLRGKGADKVYTCEMDDAKHTELLKECKDARCCILLCGYHQEPDLYDQVLEVDNPESPWRRYVLGKFVKSCQTKAKRDIAAETIWINYPIPHYAHYYISTAESEDEIYAP